MAKEVKKREAVLMQESAKKKEATITRTMTVETTASQRMKDSQEATNRKGK